MSAVPYWLQKQRKPELHELAAHVGLKNYDKLLKLDLEEALNKHLRTNQTRLEKDPMLSGFYKRLDTPVKRERESGGHGGTGSAVAIPPTPLFAPSWIRYIANKRSDSDNAPQATPGASSSLPLTTTTTTAQQQSLHPHTPPPSSSFSTADIITTTTTTTNNNNRRGILPALPASPSLLADAIEETTSTLTHSATNLYTTSPLPRTLHTLRTALSSVTSIHLLTLAAEIFGILTSTTPMKYATTIPPLPALGLLNPLDVKIPDLFAMLTLEFWAPVMLWLVTAILVPAAGAWFLNLTGEGGYDPVAFGVVRGLGAWIVFFSSSAPTSSSSAAAARVDSIRVVERSVPGGATGMLVGSAVGVLAGVYEAVLRK
ncbi:hypothetical protein Q9189_001898 [Teloschistes chrysophthalmus]